MYEFFLLLLLLYFSYSDIRTREVDDRLVYASFVLGLLLNIHRMEYVAVNIFITGVMSLLLYIAGIFAMGDVWILLIISAFVPETVNGMPVSIISLVLGSLITLVMGIGRVVLSRLDEYLKGFIQYTLPVSGFFSLNVLVGIISTFFIDTYILRAVGYLLLVFTLFTKTLHTLFITSLLFVVYTLLFTLKHINDLFTREKEPEEGDVPAVVVDKEGNIHPFNVITAVKILKGEIKPVHNISADGLSKEDVKRLKDIGIKTLPVKETLPFIPFITAGYILYLLWKNILPFLSFL